ncbi:DMT family transporter [Candidatus Lariskella endosymbiont of Epinotia ramella]|uniref:DMT family transporter n=1 Tax=Candidatus Lariskella endosymbiont of Epinotia ramella TaxID=3066224 RepID=UPI0030D122FD
MLSDSNAKNSNMVAMLFMAVNAVSLGSLYAVMKCITYSVNSNQATFLYKSIIFLFLLPWVFYKDGLNVIKTPNIKIHLLRSVFSAGGSLSMMYSLKFLKLLDVTALTHIEQVLWIIIGAVFFNERITLIKIIAVILAFLGGFIVVKPEVLYSLFSDEKIVSDFNEGYFFVFLTVGFWVVNSSLVKLLGHRKASNKAQLFYVMLFASLISYCVAFIEWKHLLIIGSFSIAYPGGFNASFDDNIGFNEFALICAASLLYLMHSIAFFYAMKGDMAVVAPLVYLKLVCTGILGFVIFGEFPKFLLSYLGYLMIIIAGVLVLYSEYKKRNSEKTAALDDIV